MLGSPVSDVIEYPSEEGFEMAATSDSVWRGPNGERAEAGKYLMVLEEGTRSLVTWKQDVRPSRSADRVSVGVHLQQVLALAPAEPLGDLSVNSRRRVILSWRRELCLGALDPVLRIEMQPDHEIVGRDSVAGETFGSDTDRAIRPHCPRPRRVR